MISKRPQTTLFLLTSVDGKISTGLTDEMDVDKDFPNIKGVKEGLHQYYEIEQTMDLWSLNSGRVMAKIGVNEREFPSERWSISFLLIDNNHLNQHGVEYFTHLLKKIVIVTSNKNHPAYKVKADNLSILYYEKLDLDIMFKDLYSKFGCEKITIQSGGTLNSLFLREKYIDFVDIVVAPILVGGKDTSSLVDGESLTCTSQLQQLSVLKLEKAEVLEDSYIRLRYKVIS